MINTDPNETKTPPATGQVVGYARVSSESQHLDRQVAALAEAGCTKIFEEKISGASRERPKLSEALDYLRDGDVLVCVSMDRLARSLPDLYNLVQELVSRGVEVMFLKEGQSYSGDSSAVASLMLGILGSVAEFERRLIRERQAEGIDQAKKRGAYRGRSKKLSHDDVQVMRDQIESGIPKARVARDMGISRATLYRYVTDCGTTS